MTPIATSQAAWSPLMATLGTESIYGCCLMSFADIADTPTPDELDPRHLYTPHDCEDGFCSLGVDRDFHAFTENIRMLEPNDRRGFAAARSNLLNTVREPLSRRMFALARIVDDGPYDSPLSFGIHEAFLPATLGTLADNGIVDNNAMEILAASLKGYLGRALSMVKNTDDHLRPITRQLILSRRVAIYCMIAAIASASLNNGALIDTIYFSLGGSVAQTFVDGLNLMKPMPLLLAGIAGQFFSTIKLIERRRTMSEELGCTSEAAVKAWSHGALESIAKYDELINNNP